MLEKITSLFMVFRKCEPRTVKFTATYFPKASIFDPKLSQEQIDFNEFCEHTGWKYVTSCGEMQIFYNENEDAIPIETDPNIAIQNIHKSMKKMYLPLYIVLGFIYALQMVLFIVRLNIRPMETLSNNFELLAVFCFLLVLILLIAEIVRYYRWRGKALRLAGNEMFFYKQRIIDFYLISLVPMMVGFVFLIVSFAGIKFMYIAVIYALIICIGGIGIGRISDIMKKHNVSTKLNRTVVVLLVILFIVVTFGGMVVVADEIMPIFEEKPVSTYEHDGITFDVYNDEIPLRIEDFMETDYSEYSTTCTESSSMIVDYIQATQKTRYDALVYQRIDYSIAVIKNPLLYDMCKKICLNEIIEEYGIKGEDDSYWYELVEVDSKSWGADSAYQIFLDDEERNHRVLFYEDRIVEIKYEDEWKLTDEQTSAIGEILNSYN